MEDPLLGVLAFSQFADSDRKRTDDKSTEEAGDGKRCYLVAFLNADEGSDGTDDGTQDEGKKFQEAGPELCLQA